MNVIVGRAVRRVANLLLGVERALLFSQLGNGWPPEARRVLVHRTGNIGDTVVAVPALLAVRELYPEAELVLLTSPGAPGMPSAADVLEGTAIVDEFALYYPGERNAERGRLWPIEQLRNRRFDLFVSLSSAGGGRRITRLVRDMLCARVAGCRRVAGFWLPSLPQQWVPSHAVGAGVFLPEFERLLALVPGGREFWRGADFQWPGLAELRQEISHLIQRHDLNEKRGFVVIHPGAKLALKRWMPDRFADLALRIGERYGTRIVLTGGGGESDLCAQVEECGSPGWCLNLAGKTNMRQFFGLLACARAVISNDTGAMHLAAAFGTPCLGLMSGRDHPAKWKPISHRHIQLRAEVHCGPCFGSECSSPECLQRISVADAARAFDRLWELYVARR